MTPPQEPAIHLVDDDESLRTALSRLLRAAGHPVHAYASAADFLLARRGPLRGCLLLDVILCLCLCFVVMFYN